MDRADEPTTAPSSLESAIALRTSDMAGLFDALVSPEKYASEHKRHQLILGLAAQKNYLRGNLVMRQLLDLTEDERAEIAKKFDVGLMDGPPLNDPPLENPP